MAKKVLVLGGGGNVGVALTRELSKHENKYEISSFSRSCDNSTNNGVTYIKGDLLDLENVLKAFEGVKVAFLVAGLPYNSIVWEDNWPKIMSNVLEACSRFETKLIFFDNIYAYGEIKGEIKENNLLNPISRKGKVRKILNDMLEEAHSNDKLKYMIVRSAEFYGPGVQNSSLYASLIENLLKDKAGYWLGSLDKLRSFTYIDDIAKALEVLSLEDKSYNQIWHVPTPKAIKGTDFVKILEKNIDKKITVKPLGKTMAKIISLFNKDLKELIEMYYQFENDYEFNSDKFMMSHPNFQITSYEHGIKETIKSFIKETK